MANEKTRILPTEVIENPDFQSSARNLTTQSVRDKITDKFSESQFETKEEYIAHLIEQHKIRKASNPSDKDKIYLSGISALTLKKRAEDDFGIEVYNRDRDN